jgi:hypothetical protein
MGGTPVSRKKWEMLWWENWQKYNFWAKSLSGAYLFFTHKYQVNGSFLLH